LRRDRRPYFIKRGYLHFQEFYVRRFLRPQLESLGNGFSFIKPWHVEIFGSPVELGHYATVIASSDQKVRLSIWSEGKGKGRIKIGDYSLILPGVRISSASEIVIGNNSMIASNTYITDGDWHDIYDRISIGKTAPVTIDDNVWIGDSVIICKGVSIGKNSVIGAGAVVVNAIPPNVVAAGNPARIVKHLDTEVQRRTRAEWYADPDRLFEELDQWDRDMLRGNTLRGWVRSLLSPNKKD
jgi:acetyltransferase-like isoleucine patch superfamily enzyme